MSFINDPQNSSKLFSAFNNIYNINQQSSEDIYDLIKSLNIIDPESLSRDELSIILKRIDDYSGLFTTQQLENIDYYELNQHVFFDSAVNKTSYSFDRIHNSPYDKDEMTNIKFNNKTDGYTDFILKNVFPKSIGYTNFIGSEKIVVYDQQGKLLNDSKTKQIGMLNPKAARFSFDFWLKVNSAGFVNNQIVFKKFEHKPGSQNGFICYITEGSLSTNCYINLAVFIDGKSTLSKCLIVKDEFQNIVINTSASNGNKKTSFAINGNTADANDVYHSSYKLKDSAFPESFSNKNIPLVLGGIFLIEDNTEINASLSLVIDSENVVFQNLNGAVDEFRLFHRIRSNKTVKKEMSKNIYAQKGLKLYLRLNEPGGSYQNCCLVIDHSGNKLHGLTYAYNSSTSSHEIVSDTTAIKTNSSSPLKLEREINSPVLNSSYTKTIDVRKKMISKAKEYDNNNPNLIFNLMPKHYFLNAADFQSLPVYSNEESYTVPTSIVDNQGRISKPTDLYPSIPGNNELVNIVLIWARFFDQLKMYISSITNFLNVDYESINKNKIIGMQIPILCKMYGIKFKELLPTATKEKLNNENLNYQDIVSEHSIRKIQNILWQRFLINTQDFLRSKGTVRSIESSFNSFGIDFSKFIDIKEYSSFNEISKNNNYKLTNVQKTIVDFGNKNELMISPTYTDMSINDYSQNKLYLEVNNIKSQIKKQDNRVETYINGLGLDWSIETIFSFKDNVEQRKSTNSSYKDKQCLMRLETDNDLSLIVFYEKNNGDNSSLGRISINIQPIKNNVSYNISLDILDVDIFNMPKYFCLTQTVDYEENTISYEAYIDDIGNQNIIKKRSSASFTTEEIVIKNNAGQITSTLSDIIANGDNLSFHNNSLKAAIGNYNYASNSLLSTLIASADDTNFQGEILKIRFWNKKLDKKEMFSHLKNIDNIGTTNNNPLSDLVADFETSSTEHTTINGVKTWNIKELSNSVIKDQTTGEYSQLNSCKLYSRNSLQDNERVFQSFNVMCKIANLKVDEPIRENRVNIVSYSKKENKTQTDNFNFFPANDLPIDFNYDEISRVSIDMSIVKVINNDISNMISDIDGFVNTISNSQSIFEYDYKQLETIRNNYFSKYKNDKIINYASIINVFKYFDNIMSSILHDIVPSRVRFEGFNFVYESHILERHKYEYKNRSSSMPLMSTENVYNFSRDIPISRRSLNYNSNRTFSKE